MRDRGNLRCDRFGHCGELLDCAANSAQCTSDLCDVDPIVNHLPLSQANYLLVGHVIYRIVDCLLAATDKEDNCFLQII